MPILLKLVAIVFCLFTIEVRAKEIVYESEDKDFILYKVEGTEPCLARRNLKVIQAQGENGLVCELDRELQCVYDGDIHIMYILGDHYYYDGEIIPNPSGKCAKQVGIHRYETVGGTPKYKTVPVIKIMDK